MLDVQWVVVSHGVGVGSAVANRVLGCIGGRLSVGQVHVVVVARTDKANA